MTLQTLDTRRPKLDQTDAVDDPFGSFAASTLRKASGGSLADLLERAPIPELESVAPATRPGLVEDADELGREIVKSALSDQGTSFAVACRSTRRATEFATPMRSLLLTLNSGFGGISATVSPALMLHTYPAMDALVSHLETSGASDIWQPVGERSLGVGDARHMFVSVDAPVVDAMHGSVPNVLVEVVGAHLISDAWFERVAKTRCGNPNLTFVFYGQRGSEGSIFERAWLDADANGVI